MLLALSSWMSKTYLKSDHFNGGGSAEPRSGLFLHILGIAVRRRWTALARSGYLIHDLANPS
jgi:hypothetical protein